MKKIVIVSALIGVSSCAKLDYSEVSVEQWILDEIEQKEENAERRKFAYFADVDGDSVVTPREWRWAYSEIGEQELNVEVSDLQLEKILLFNERYNTMIKVNQPSKCIGFYNNINTRPRDQILWQ